MYIARHDGAARMGMKEIRHGSMGNYYCTADVGTAEAMLDLGATSKRLPDWLLTPETMQKAKFSPQPLALLIIPWRQAGRPAYLTIRLTAFIFIFIHARQVICSCLW